MLLEMRDVSKAFGATRALDGVSLELESGEVRALIGENGAGKSTLMKILSGAIRPDRGSMNLNGAAYCAARAARGTRPRRGDDLSGAGTGAAPVRRSQRHARPGEA